MYNSRIPQTSKLQVPERTLIRQLVEEMKRLNSQPEKPPKPDWWARASVISGFVSSVVIAIVGLAITSSSIQRQQLETAKLKDESDERIQRQQVEAQRERGEWGGNGGGMGDGLICAIFSCSRRK